MAPPKAILFDIGGVCVLSPFRAILDYERAHSIPEGYINFAIQKGPAETGAWQRIERGEVELNDAWFTQFKSQLENPTAWREFCSKRGMQEDDAQAKTPPTIDAKRLFWDMMRISRTPDPYMYPALRKLATFTIPSTSPSPASTTTSTPSTNQPQKQPQQIPQFLLGALSNTIRFPSTIYDETNTPFTTSLIHPPSTSPSSPFPPSPLPNFDPTNITTHFHAFLSSAHLGVRKPSPQAYALAVRELSRLSEARGTGVVEPGDVVFLDDIGANLKAAREVGLRTIKVGLGRTREAVGELEGIVGRRLLDDEAEAMMEMMEGEGGTKRESKL